MLDAWTGKICCEDFEIRYDTDRPDTCPILCEVKPGDDIQIQDEIDEANTITTKIYRSSQLVKEKKK